MKDFILPQKKGRKVKKKLHEESKTYLVLKTELNLHIKDK